MTSLSFPLLLAGLRLLFLSSFLSLRNISVILIRPPVCAFI